MKTKENNKSTNSDLGNFSEGKSEDISNSGYLDMQIVEDEDGEEDEPIVQSEEKTTESRNILHHHYSGKGWLGHGRCYTFTKSKTLTRSTREIEVIAKEASSLYSSL